MADTTIDAHLRYLYTLWKNACARVAYAETDAEADAYIASADAIAERHSQLQRLKEATT